MREEGAVSPDSSQRFGSTARETLMVSALLFISACLQLYVISSHRIPVNSDQAVVGLMAKHILEGKGHPVFFYGVTYAGSLEPHYVAAVFSVIGASPTSYRIAMACLTFMMILGVFVLTRRIFGRSAGLASLVYLSIPPFFFLYKGLTSDGAYDSVCLTALGTLAIAFAIDERLASGAQRPILFWLLGFAIGLGWWVMPLTAGVSAAALGWLFLRRERRPRWREGTQVLAGVLLGSFPWWFWNLQQGWASLRAPELGLVGIPEAISHAAGLLWTSIPVLEGGIRSTPDPTFFRETFPLSRLLSLAALTVVLATTANASLRQDRRLRLLWLTLGAVGLMAAFSQRLNLSEPRYLVAYYVITPILTGAAFVQGRVGWRRSAALVVLLSLHVISIVDARVSDVATEGEVTGSIKPLLSYLEGSGNRSVYADYWTAYRLSFESAERVVATPLPGDELVRYPPYQDQVDRSPSASVVLLEARGVCFEAYLRQKEISHRRSQVGPFGVFSALGDRGLKTLRKGWGLPLPRQAHRAAWRLGTQPSKMVISQVQSVRVEAWNRGPCRWPVSVHLGYHWWPTSPGGTAIYEGSRGFLSDLVKQGDWATFVLTLVAPPSPGRYRLEYDLVQENIEWFSNDGGNTASVDVDVVGRSPVASKP